MGFASVAGEGIHEENFTVAIFDAGKGTITPTIKGAVVLLGSRHSHHTTRWKVNFFAGNDGIHRVYLVLTELNDFIPAFSNAPDSSGF
jgi:hypothetical protein